MANIFHNTGFLLQKIFTNLVLLICVEYCTDYHTVHNARSDHWSLIVKLKQDI